MPERACVGILIFARQRTFKDHSLCGAPARRSQRLQHNDAPDFVSVQTRGGGSATCDVLVRLRPSQWYRVDRNQTIKSIGKLYFLLIKVFQLLHLFNETTTASITYWWISFPHCEVDNMCSFPSSKVAVPDLLLPLASRPTRWSFSPPTPSFHSTAVHSPSLRPSSGSLALYKIIVFILKFFVFLFEE